MAKITRICPVCQKEFTVKSNRPRQIFCGKICFFKGRKLPPGRKPILSIEDRFWNKVKKTGPKECWLWQTEKGDHNWYGTFSIRRGETCTSHRMAYILTYGPIPKGKFVLHSCDNPPCCNPSHLRIGTHSDNMHDKVIRDRQPRGESHPSKYHPESVRRGDNHPARLHPEIMRRGERHPNHKLDSEKVLQIRYLYRTKQYNQYQLAEMFGCARPTIGYIVNGKSWKHLIT